MISPPPPGERSSSCASRKENSSTRLTSLPARFLSGPGAREKQVFGRRPLRVVVTDRGLFKFDPETKEMYLEAIYPGMDVEQIKELIDWDLKVSPDLYVMDPPTEEQITVMRTLDPMGTVLGRKSLRGEIGPFDVYYNSLKKSYQGRP